MRLGRNCKKIGHDKKEIHRNVYLYPSTGYSGVADGAEQTKEVCKGFFCDWSTNWETDESTRSTINSLSMGSDKWRTLKKNGVTSA